MLEFLKIVCYDIVNIPGGTYKMVCRNCNTMNADNAKFCAKCGAALFTNNQPQYAQQQPYAGGYQPQMPGAPIEEPGKGMAVASMILGIISFFCFAVITGILAVIFGAVAKSKGNRSGMATAGIVCGAIALALWLIGIVMMCSTGMLFAF